MLDRTELHQIVSAAATAVLGNGRVGAVRIEPTADSEGRDALRVMLVLAPGSLASISGDKALDTIVAIQNRLLEAGEDRFPIIQFATEEELAESDSPDP
jgi:hypothetical protein